MQLSERTKVDEDEVFFCISSENYIPKIIFGVIFANFCLK